MLNMSPENKAHMNKKKKAIHFLLTRIGDEIYLTVDASKTAHKIWIAIKRLQQGESLNIQDEVNEIRAERIAKNANPLALVAAAQPPSDPYYQASKSHKSYAPTSKTSPTTISHATTRHKGKETAKPITPPFESAFKEDSDPEQAQKDKEMHKNVKYKRINDPVDVIIMLGGQSKTQPTTTMAVVKDLEREIIEREMDGKNTLKNQHAHTFLDHDSKNQSYRSCVVGLLTIMTSLIRNMKCEYGVVN
nr:hypothetical protein [Tanacetum cinerariifolium]